MFPSRGGQDSEVRNATLCGLFG